MIKCARPKPEAELRLFCFPYAGGGASVFRSWSDQLPNQVEVCAIQLPGREDRFKESPLTRLSSLMGMLLPTFDAYLDLPFAFFGHSVGALVCFEFARQLRRQGNPIPSHLFVSGRRAPQLPDSDLPIHQLPDPLLIRELQCFGGTPESVLENAELMDMFLPVLRADLAIDETYEYKPEPPLDCSISAFGGLKDSKVSPESLDGWRDQTCAAFDSKMFAGGHFFLKREADALLDTLAAELQLIQAQRSFNGRLGNF